MDKTRLIFVICNDLIKQTRNVLSAWDARVNLECRLGKNNRVSRYDITLPSNVKSGFKRAMRSLGKYSPSLGKRSTVRWGNIARRRDDNVVIVRNAVKFVA